MENKYKVNIGIYGVFDTTITDIDYTTASKIARNFIDSVKEKGECICSLSHMGIVGIIYDKCFAKINPIEVEEPMPWDKEQ